MDRTTFTVAEIAQAVIGGDQIETLLRRIRHWTVAGLLEPVEGTHTGPGRHRRYAGSIVYLVALLNELADKSLPIGVLKQVAREIPRIGVVDDEHKRLLKGEPESERRSFYDLKKRERRLWEEAISGAGQVYLSISFLGDFEDERMVNSLFVELCRAEEIHEGFGESTRSLIVIDATRVWGEICSP